MSRKHELGEDVDDFLMSLPKKISNQIFNITNEEDLVIMNSLTIVIACKKVDEKMILVRSSVVRGNPPPLLRGLDSSMAQSK